MSKVVAGPRIAPFLWFNNNAEEAVDFYISVFPNSRRLEELRNPGGAPVPVGGILTISFELDGQRFVALNGGPAHTFNEAISFFVNCETQKEIDYYWEKLLGGGGSEIACGWLKDKFGVRWQVVPTHIFDLVKHTAGMQAMLKMTKFDIAKLESAVRGG